MRVTRAVALLPVLPHDLPVLEDSLEHLIEAADEASAAGVATTLLLTTSAPAAATDPVLASWRPLVDLLDGVDLLVEHHPGAVPGPVPDPAQEVTRLLARAAAGRPARRADPPPPAPGGAGPGGGRRAAGAPPPRLDDPPTTVVLTTTPDVAVGPDWITEHVRHHRGGATASTGPVRRGGTGPDHRHDTVANLAVRADLLPAGVLSAVGRGPLVHALTPVVAGLVLTLRASP